MKDTTYSLAPKTYMSGLSYAAHGGKLCATLGNGAIEAVGYNTRLQPTSISLTKDSTVLQKYEYKYGQVDQSTGTVDETKNNGQIARIEGYIGSTRQWQQRFSYDSLGRLSTAGEYRGDTLALTYKSNYSYDRWGNRYQRQSENSQSLGYVPVEDTDISPSTNRLTSNTTYDDAGNVTVDQKFRGLRYRYDANGRMWKSANVDNTSPATSVYDGLGQRVQATDSNNTKTLVYDAFGRLVSEYDTQAQTGSGTKYLMSDLQGSARVLTNESGTVIARHDYQAFGGEIGATIGLRTTDQKYNASDSTRQRYALTERDATGLDHTGWRKYDNSSGRWTSPDLYNGSMLLSDPQSFNRYVYVHNDPINFVDSVGAQETPTDGGPISFPIPYTVNPDGSISTTFNIEVGPYGTVWNLPSGVSGGGRGIHPPLQGTDTEEGTGHGGGGGNDPNGRDHKQNSVQHKKGKSFLDALNYCIRDYYGLDKLLKRGGIAAALFPLTKKMIGVKRLGNASRYVPVISWLGWKLFPNANTAFKTFGTFRFFGQLGRGYLPLLGATLTLFDALAISLCVSEQMNR